MKNTLYFVMILPLLCSCGQSPRSGHAIPVSDTTVVVDTSNSYAEQSESIAKEIEEEYTELTTDSFYIVQVAEGSDYDSLLQIAQQSAGILGSRFDMLDRVYEPGRGIIVSASSDDELYRGEYYPRRPFEDQNFVSIEMATAFGYNQADKLKMVVLANICTSKSRADSMVTILKKDFEHAKSLKQELFMGCMH
jgi:hypothetical protein